MGVDEGQFVVSRRHINGNLPRCIVLFALALSGCMTRLHSPPPDFLSRPQNESLVIGRVWSPYDLLFSAFAFTDRLNPLILSIRSNSTGKNYEIPLTKNEGGGAYFYIALPPGRYYVTGVRRPNPQAPSTQSFFELKFPTGGRSSAEDQEGRQPRFEVGAAPAGPPSAVIYVGTLVMTVATPEQGAHRDFLGVYHEATHYHRGWNVRDESAEMEKAFRTKYPQATQAISKSLMTD